MNEWIIVAIVAVGVIFGANKIPQMARSFGRAQGEFKKGLKEGDEPDEPRTDRAMKSSGLPEAKES
jgi:Sec-independent protein secretion pathway components